MSDLISRRAVLDALRCNIIVAGEENEKIVRDALKRLFIRLYFLPSEHTDSCKGCKHMGLWDDEIEYGYPSPCTRCKRSVSDNYER